MNPPTACKTTLLLAACCFALCPTSAAAAEDFPAKPVRLIVPYSAGGTVDTVARLIGQQLGQTWHQPVVVDNRPGAGGNLGTDMVAKSTPDGYTLMINSPAVVIAPSVYKKLPFDPFKDLAPVINIGITPALLVVNPQMKANNIGELIAFAKNHPGQLNFGSSGTGTSLHLAGELFKSMAKIDIVHVPYKGTQPALMDVMGGQIQLLFDSVTEVLPFLEAGKVKALAVSTSKRSSRLPDIPTIGESGVPEYDFSMWYGIFAAGGTPPNIVHKLNHDIDQVLAQPATREKMKSLGVDIVGGSVEQFSSVIDRDARKWSVLVKGVGIKLD